jgi:ATP-dependent exoDNAse (exonuclease V) alpha subunit
MKVIYTDSLVIGGGLAGLRVAIASMQRGCETTVLSLMPAKRSHSAAAQGGMQASLGAGIKGEGDNEEVHFEDTVKGSDWGGDQVMQQVLAHRVVVITGGPGTGKTTLIRAVCAVFKKLRQTVTLSAPTGRAARRLFQVTEKKASTLHRLLLCDPDTGEFARNPMNPLDSDVVIVDEASMVDTMLMYHLIQAVPVNSVLILVGDIFQLPSVGPGNVLADIIASDAVKTFALTRIFRQAEQSPIVRNAHCIRKGEMPCLENSSKELSEFYFIESSSMDRVVETILELDELTLAYAVSVHKSQGSEYSAVVIAMTTQHYPLLQRNLLYTAMTRGRDLVIVVGSRRAVEISLNNNRIDDRLSGLAKHF